MSVRLWRSRGMGMPWTRCLVVLCTMALIPLLEDLYSTFWTLLALCMNIALQRQWTERRLELILPLQHERC
jgi:hypothetical protein